ncbi:MAG: SurA N-terminal domain-containing protein [Verrucomicrobiia bacterium]
MIGTIRKHSKWLWWFIAGLTIISFIYWGAGPSRVGGGGGRMSGDFGTIYGHKVTQQDYVEARNEFYIFYRIHYNQWPDKNPNLSRNDQEREIYVHLLFDLKAADLGIHIGDDVVEQAAAEMLRSFGRNGQPVPMDSFVRQFLQPEGLTAEDFARYVRHDLVIQQLIQTMGLPGELVTPQAAAAEYERLHREFSAQAVFFSASNYLSAVTATPAAVAEFYTNYLAAYRLPDRVQVSYVEFNASNYLAQAKAEWAKTNFEEVVEANYRQLDPDYFPDAKTPDAAKAKIRELLIRNRALTDANQQANDFASALFALEPVKPENLATVARQKGLTVRLTAPFASAYGPEEFDAPPEFTKTAFELTPDEPLAGPVAGPGAVYIIALIKQLPSEIPAFDQIRARVTGDYRLHEATLRAQRAGTNFVHTLTGPMAAGHTFASACVAAGLQPQALPPFSLSTRDLPELGERAELDQLKQAAFTTPVGHASGFVETGDGGFVLYVQSQLPVEQAVMNAQLPQFIAQLRHAQQDDAFNEWLQIEASRALRSTPAYQPQTAPSAR